MIEDSQHDSKRTLAEFLYYLVAVPEMFVVTMYVLVLVCVETIVVFIAYLAVSRSTRQIMVSSVFNTLIYVEEVDYVVLQDLSLFNLPQIRRKQADGVVSAERKFDLGTLTGSTLLFVRMQL